MIYVYPYWGENFFQHSKDILIKIWFLQIVKFRLDMLLIIGSVMSASYPGWLQHCYLLDLCLCVPILCDLNELAPPDTDIHICITKQAENFLHVVERNYLWWPDSDSLTHRTTIVNLLQTVTWVHLHLASIMPCHDKLGANSSKLLHWELGLTWT